MSSTIPAGILQASGRTAEGSRQSADLYLDHELSLLVFQGRVLDEARYPANPLLERVKRLIRREIQHASDGNSARLVFKLNSLEDHPMIRLLYEASQAGIKVDLLVRGICCLRPGVPGLSENIQVTSIVGRFLEHSRIYYFYNVGAEEVYLGSADLMGRNLDRRIEVLFPVENPRLIARLRDDILARYLVDDRNARRMAQDGSYAWNPGPSNSHAQFLRQASLLPADNATS